MKRLRLAAGFVIAAAIVAACGDIGPGPGDTGRVDAGNDAATALDGRADSASDAVGGDDGATVPVDAQLGPDASGPIVYRLDDATTLALPERTFGSSLGPPPTRMTRACPAGEVLVGIAATTALAGGPGPTLCSLTPRCAQVRDDGTLAQAHDLAAIDGGGSAGGVCASAMRDAANCAADEAMVGAQLDLGGPNGFGFSAQCAPVRGWITAGALGGTPAIGRPSPGIGAQQACPVGYALTEVTLGVGMQGGSVGYRCTRVLPAAGGVDRVDLLASYGIASVGLATGTDMGRACAIDEVVVGVEGRADTMIRAIAPRCAVVFDDGRLGAAHSLVPAGATTGTPFRVDCPAGSALANLGGQTNASGLNQFQPRCAPVAGWISAGTRGGHLANLGEQVVGATIFDQDCPAGYFLRALAVRTSATGVAALGGSCSRVFARATGTYQLDAMAPAFDLASQGGGAGSAFTLACAPGAVVVGLTGRADGAGITALAPRCATLAADGTIGAPWSLSPSGGAAGTAFTIDCPMARLGMSVFGQVGPVVQHLALSCAATPQWVLGAQWAFNSLEAGPSGTYDYYANCPPGFLLTALAGRTDGAHVTSLAPRCQRVLP